MALLMNALVACLTSKQRDAGVHQPCEGRCWKTPRLSRSPQFTGSILTVGQKSNYEGRLTVVYTVRVCSVA
jgi:hypothetical protein